MAAQTWDYIKQNIADYDVGEWFWSRNADGSVNRTDDKAGFWKCPYHNSRMCLEVYSILGEMLIDISFFGTPWRVNQALRCVSLYMEMP